MSQRAWSQWCLILLVACGNGGDPASGSPSEPTLPGGGSSAGGGENQGGSGGSEGPVQEPPTSPALRFERIELGVSGPTDFQFIPGTENEVLVTAHNGAIHHLRLSEGEAAELDTGALEVFWKEGCGLLSLAFDPAFTDNGFVYLARCSDLHTSTLSRYRFGPLSELAATEAEIMTLTIPADPPEIWHRWGSMGFEPDGETMWALHGDMFVRELAQDITTAHGSLLRFIPNRDPEGAGYEPAVGNAVDLMPEAEPTVYAYGLRSPWRGYLDRDGRYWIGDVGLITAEEINLVTEPTQNLGWPTAEGRCAESCESLTEPLLTFGRASDEPYVLEDPDTEPATKRAVWLGVRYEEPAAQRYYGLLDDLVLYGDFFTGWVRGVKVDAQGRIEQDVLLGHLTEVTSVRLGPDGYLYLLTLNGGLYRAKQVLPE